jgi:heptosyltransferase-2
MKRLLVVQTWGVGDTIMSTPMLGAIRNRWPGAWVELAAGNGAAAQVVQESRLVDRVHILGTGKKLHARFLLFAASCRWRRYDAAVICTRISPRIATVLTTLGGLRAVVGDSTPEDRRRYTHWTPLDPYRHRVVGNLAILNALAGDATPGPLYFHTGVAAQGRAEQLWQEWGLAGRDVLAIHPGSDGGQTDKRLPPAKCNVVVRRYLDQAPEARVLIFVGPAEEALRSCFPADDPRVRIVSDQPLRVVAAILGRARVLWAGDSGLGHIAAAMGTPVVTLFGPTESRCTGPWGPNCVALRTDEPEPCMPCYETPLFGRCPYGQRCLTQIADDRIIDSLMGLTHH